MATLKQSEAKIKRLNRQIQALEGRLASERVAAKQADKVLIDNVFKFEALFYEEEKSHKKDNERITHLMDQVRELSNSFERSKCETEEVQALNDILAGSLRAILEIPKR